MGLSMQWGDEGWGVCGLIEFWLGDLGLGFVKGVVIE